MTPTPLERILIIHDYSGLGGGAELVVQQLRDARRGRGIDARLLTSTADSPIAGSEPDRTYAGGTGRLRSLREIVNPSAVLSLRRVLRDFDPQGVYLGMFLTQASPAILPCLSDRAVIWAPNEFRPVCPRGTRLLPNGTRCDQPVGRACLASGCFRPWGLAPRLAQLSLLRRWLNVVDRTLAPSRVFAELLERHGISVAGVLRHPVPVGSGKRRRHATPIVAFAGRLVPEKGAHIAIRAFAKIVADFPAARLWMAGDGPERSRLEALGERMGVAENVDYFGHLPRPELERRLSGAWVQCVPSIWHEPFGLVTIEAQARGTPVIASAVGAQPELIVPGRTGYLVAPGDPAALASVITDLFADPEAADRVGDAARDAVVKNFDGDTCIDHLLNEFEDIQR